MEFSPLPKPHKTGRSFGIPIVTLLLKPGVKNLLDTMHKFKGCYIGITADKGAMLYIDNNPVIKVLDSFLDDIKMCLADDVKVYDEITEYRLLPERYKQILIYYM